MGIRPEDLYLPLRMNTRDAVEIDIRVCWSRVSVDEDDVPGSRNLGLIQVSRLYQIREKKPHSRSISKLHFIILEALQLAS